MFDCAFTPARMMLSFARSDRPAAIRLAGDLSGRGIEPLIDHNGIPEGGNFIDYMGEVLAESDYYVLLWSAAAADRPWARAGWAAALALELELVRQRCFLVVLRLDRTPLPPLLAPRDCLDIFDGWDTAVDRLTAGWARDLAIGAPLFPAPRLPANDDAPRPAVVYVHNHALAVAHVVVIPQKATGAQLMEMVCSALQLPPVVTRFGGAAGIRFAYELTSTELLLPADPHAPIDIQEGATIQLEVEVTWFGPHGDSPSVKFRREENPDAAPAAFPSLLRKAFGHLTP